MACSLYTKKEREKSFEFLMGLFFLTETILFKKAKVLVCSTDKWKGRGRDRREASLLEETVCTMTPERKHLEHRETRGDGPRWCPEPQHGELNVFVPERGAVPESQLQSLGGGIKRTQRDPCGSGTGE